MNRRSFIAALGAVIPILAIKPGTVFNTSVSSRTAFSKVYNDFKFKIVSGSLAEATSLQHKLLCLQLHKAGLIDSWKLLDELGIPSNVRRPL